MQPVHVLGALKDDVVVGWGEEHVGGALDGTQVQLLDRVLGSVDIDHRQARGSVGDRVLDRERAREHVAQAGATTQAVDQRRQAAGVQA